jgi:WD40 repeat protein
MAIGFDISNCYRYLLSGSEDRSAYIYDVGSGQVIEKTKSLQHGDSVTDVAVNPEYLEWATSSIDGHVRMFRYPAVKVARKVKPKNGGGGGFGLMVKGKKATLAPENK